MGFLIQLSETKAKAILTLLISDLVDFFNVGKTMNDYQVAQTINMIFEDTRLRNLKPDDFKLCFKRLKSGHYGKSYDRIDGQIIFDALNQYTDERMNECENLSIKQHKEHLDDRSVPADTEGQKKVIEILKESLKDSPVANFIKEENVKKQIVKSARDRFIQSCFTEFYKLWQANPYKPPKKQPAKSPGLIDNDETGGRYIEFNGKIVDEVEYAKIKVTEYDSLLSKGEG